MLIPGIEFHFMYRRLDRVNQIKGPHMIAGTKNSLNVPLREHHAEQVVPISRVGQEGKVA